MIPDRRSVGESRKSGLLRSPHRWAVWALPSPARAWLLGTELAAAAGTTSLILLQPLTGPAAARAAVLAILALGYAEATRRIERVRIYLAAGGSTPRAAPLSVWSFAAVVVLPAGWAAAVLAMLYAQEFLHARLDRTGRPHRLLFTAAAALVAQLVAGLVAAAPHGDEAGPAAAAVLIGAALIYTTVNLAILLTGMWLATGRPRLRGMLPDADAIGYDLSCLALGLAAGQLVAHSPYATPVLLGPVAYLHRSAMVKSLHRAARTDLKTGLLNAAAWSEHASAVLARCARAAQSAAILVLDIDHFKQINDTRGHLVGDRMLHEVAGVLRHEVRGHDRPGRFGGDEFVVVLDDVSPHSARDIAQRLHTALAAIRVDDLTLSLSLGLAHTNQHGTELNTLLAAADAALYTAKASGRAQFCIASPPTGDGPVLFD